MFDRDMAMDSVRRVAASTRVGVIAFGAALLGFAGCLAGPGEIVQEDAAFLVDMATEPALAPLDVEMTVSPDAGGISPLVRPATVTAYQVFPSCAPVSLKTMMVEFNTFGTPEELTHDPGVLHVSQRGRHLFYYPDGAGEFVDLRYMGPDAPPIQPMPNQALFEAAEELLDDLGALDAGPVTVTRKGIQGIYRDAGGSAAGNGLLTHQVAVLEQRIDKIKAFGPGARVEVVFPGDDFPAEASHAIRCLEPDETAVPQDPDDALRSFHNRVERGELWDLLGEQLDLVCSVDVQRVRLGYYVPRIGEPAEVVDPVYEISGVAKGYDSGAELRVDEFLWFEPAIPLRAIPTDALQD